MRYAIMTTLALLCAACEKEELPAPVYDRGDAITSQVDIGPSYKNQVWYSLADNRIVSLNQRTDWDLAFESSVEGKRIMLNGANGMKVYKTTYTELSEVTDTTGMEANGKIDAPSGTLDSTAFGNWEQQANIYIVNRGYDDSGVHLGYYKLKLQTVNATQFTFTYGDVFGTSTMQGTVHKAPDRRFVMFSLSAGRDLFIEPRQTDYDICFTSYTHFFTDPFQYYQVAGVFQNTYRTRTLRLKDKPFAEITLSDTLGKVFSTNRNAIGYDWKEFSLNTSQYTVHQNTCYIIQDGKGYFYKLHFIDFYTSAGMKGAPKFEFKKL